MFKKVLVAHDGSAGAAKAFSAAITMAAELHAELHMISVEELPQLPASIDEVVEEKNVIQRGFDKLVAHARLEAKMCKLPLVVHVVSGHAVSKIVECVEQNGFDLLIVGYMGHSALYNRLIGSTTDRLVEHAPCAVLVIK